MIRYAELPYGVHVLRIYKKRGATVGASLIECHHDPEYRTASDFCTICRTANPARPVKQLAHVPPGPRREREPVQASLF